LKNDKKTLLIFKGILTAEYAQEILIVAERKMRISEASYFTKKKVFNALMECTQNISIHTGNFPATISLQETPEHFQICTQNQISAGQKENLKKTIFQAMNPTIGYVKHKREILDSSTKKNKSPGLGLLHIIEKSNQQIQYHFKGKKHTLSFQFQFKINKTDENHTNSCRNANAFRSF